MLHGIFVLLVSTGARASAPCSLGLSEEFRFHASAPIVDALLSPRGSVALTSLDGYVHALGPGGRFLWSYTLDSAPVAVDIGLDGRVYAASETGAVHVLRPSGERDWEGHLPAGMVPTGPIAHSERGVVFVPSNLNVYAFSVGSGILWRAFIGSRIVSGPILGPDGDAWVVAQNGEVHRIRTPSQRSTFALHGNGEAPLGEGDVRIVGASSTQVFVLGASGLSAYRVEEGSLSRVGALAPTWTLSAVEQVTVDVRVARSGSRWLWLNQKGETVGERELALEVSAEPAHAAGRVFVPGANGRLYVFERDGQVEWCQVAHAPLLSPRVHAAGGGVLVASGDGWLVGIQPRSRKGER